MQTQIRNTGRVKNKFFANTLVNIQLLNQLKLLWFLISFYDSKNPNHKSYTHDHAVRIDDLKGYFNEKKRKWGNYRMLENFQTILAFHYFELDEVHIQQRFLPHLVNFFSSVRKGTDKEGLPCMIFRFNQEFIDSYLSEMESNYFTYSLPIIQKMRTLGAINLYMDAQSYVNEKGRFSKHSVVRERPLFYEYKNLNCYTIERNERDNSHSFVEKKKYQGFRAFKPKFMSAIKEVEANSHLVFHDFVFRRGQKGRINSIGYHITATNNENVMPDAKVRKAPTERQLNQLAYPKKRAYEHLIDYIGTSTKSRSIAFNTLLPNIKGEPMKGYEDRFVLFAIEYFKAHSKSKNPGAFVQWWTKHKTFSPNGRFGGIWGAIVEELHAYKKKNQKEDYIRHTSLYINSPGFEAWKKTGYSDDFDFSPYEL